MAAAHVILLIGGALQAKPNAVNGAGMKDFLLQFFTWWNGQTLGTRFYTWRKGELVGSDEGGNRYYRERGGDRRWVIYNGAVEAVAHPARLARLDAPPHRRAAGRLSAARVAEAASGEPHRHGRRPIGRPGSILGPEPRTPGAPDYEAWRP